MIFLRRLPEWTLLALIVVGFAAPWYLGAVPPQTSPTLAALPSFEHWLGTDDVGHDLAAMLACGARTAFGTALTGAALAMVIGVPLGAIAGFCGGWFDVLLLRVIEVFLCFPRLFLVLAVGSFVGPSSAAIVLVIGSLGWVAFARITRGEMLSIREREYVLAARGLGVSVAGTLIRHALPSARGPILVTAAFLCADAVVVESTIAFLGLGPGLQVPSWGSLVHQGRLHAADGKWHLWLFPTLVLIAAVWSLHVLADRVAGTDRARS